MKVTFIAQSSGGGGLGLVYYEGPAQRGKTKWAKTWELAREQNGLSAAIRPIMVVRGHVEDLDTDDTLSDL